MPGTSQNATQRENVMLRSEVNHWKGVAAELEYLRTGKRSNNHHGHKSSRCISSGSKGKGKASSQANSPSNAPSGGSDRGGGDGGDNNPGTDDESDNNTQSSERG